MNHIQRMKYLNSIVTVENKRELDDATMIPVEEMYASIPAQIDYMKFILAHPNLCKLSIDEDGCDEGSVLKQLIFRFFGFITTIT